MSSFLLAFFARGAAVLALALLINRRLRRTSAALRVTVLATALAAVLVLPVLAAVVPSWHLGGFATGAPPAISEPVQLPAGDGARMTAAASPGAGASAASASALHVPWAALAT
ncbi:MAG TPA: hypothetical protein VFP84_18135, partial [Kofleriaceae bacterium]|nr:hypothetical protein [Kofleriaceae bacterium]